jgi:hypothetical protein
MVLHPVGPLPASTYWRRRLVLLLLLVALALVARSCVADGSDKKNASANPTPSVSSRATQQPTPRPSVTRAAGPVTCADSALTLTASTDAPQYPAPSTVKITLTVKNVSSSTCRRDLGNGVLEVLVHSGADRIWSSDDCATDKGVAVQTLRPGASLETTVSWSGKRSARGCTGSKADARPGTYTVRARVGTLRSAVIVFRLRG